MKILQLQQELLQRNIDACVLQANDSNLRYLCGGQVEPEHGYLIVPAEKNAVLITTGFEVPRLRKTSLVKQFIAVTPQQSSAALLKRALGRMKTIGLNYNSVPVAAAAMMGKGRKRKDIGGILVKLRQQKTEEELQRMKTAAAITDKIFAATFAHFSRFGTENDVRRFMAIAAEEAGCGLAFPPIVASGRNGALPHYSGSEKLRKGFCVIDFGVKWKGYCSDVTRTIYVGRPKRKEVEIYATVAAANEEGIARVKAGAEAAAVDAAARRTLGRLAPYFIHGLGHQVGIDVHDSGIGLSPKSRGKLEESMVVTVEPGVYFPGKFGIRIEDDVVVQKRGRNVLSSFSRELHVVHPKGL